MARDPLRDVAPVAVPAAATTIVLTTERLILRRFVVDDAPFIFELLNDPAWLRFIGDKGVKTLDDARNYMRKGPMAMYDRVGFGLYLTELKDGRHPDRNVWPDQARFARRRRYRFCLPPRIPGARLRP